jgi:hypothetical protein
MSSVPSTRSASVSPSTTTSRSALGAGDSLIIAIMKSKK